MDFKVPLGDPAQLHRPLHRAEEPRRIERFLVLARQSGADPTLVLTKSDLAGVPEAEARRIEERLNGVPVYAVCAQTGRGMDALDECLRPAHTIVLLDMNLPTQRDGLTCLKRLRKRDADLKIVMVSGQQEIQTAIETMKMGACDYVVKPFDAARLLRSVQRAIQMRRITEGDFEIEALPETHRGERTAAAR